MYDIQPAGQGDGILAERLRRDRIEPRDPPQAEQTDHQRRHKENGTKIFTHLKSLINLIMSDAVILGRQHCKRLYHGKEAREIEDHRYTFGQPVRKSPDKQEITGGGRSAVGASSAFGLSTGKFWAFTQPVSTALIESQCQPFVHSVQKGLIARP